MLFTSTQNQKNLPRYFSRVFDMACNMNFGQLDFALSDGRVFRAIGRNQGPIAQLNIHNPDIFARLIREGDLGFCDAYLDQWWSTPDLQAFMDLIHADNDDLYDGFPGMALVRFYEKFRFWLQRNSKKQALKNISYHYDLGNDFYPPNFSHKPNLHVVYLVRGQRTLITRPPNGYTKCAFMMVL